MSTNLQNLDVKNRILSWWLARGFALLPSQPNTKYLVQGFGQYQRKITTTREAFKTFRAGCNVSVLGHGGTIILDFDDIEIYKAWIEKNPDYAKTYTEHTPRGGRHVFLFGRVPELIELKKGVELKRVCMVAPSVVNGSGYIRGTGEILEVNTTDVFSPLSIVGTKTAYVLRIEQNKRARSVGVGMSVIEKIKQHVEIERIFLSFQPSQKITSSGRYVSVICPFHEDHHASMSLDRELNLFKCHACGVHGDVINLYARFSGKTNSESISLLSRMAGSK
jgi:hypothetical protein